MTWTVHDLGLLPGGIFSIAQAANSDGTVIVGVADADGFGDGHAFWWTQASGLVDLGVLAGGTQSIAYAVSADGTKVVGQSDGGSAPLGSTVAVLWTVTGGGTSVVATELGYLATGNSSVASAISADGTTITGLSTVTPGDPLFLPTHPFRKVGAGSLTDLGLLAGNTDGIGQAVSSDGSVVFGGSNDPADNPWRWTAGSGVVAIPLPGGATSGFTLASSADGLAAAGFTTAIDGSFGEAFRWVSAGDTTTSLGFISGGTESQANGISGDGGTVVGVGDNPSISLQAFVWTQADGMLALPGLNVSSPGGNAHGISSDGRVIVGQSVGNEGGPLQHAVYWTLDTPPSNPLVDIADLWFSNTSGFVPLSVDSNRRRFISVLGGAQGLGATGELPTGVTPPVFLTDTGSPASFAANAGRGGAFSVTGGTLAAAASNPPGSATHIDTFVPPTNGRGVLGGYIDGNLYAFNAATLTDNGTPRKWVRRWRGMPEGTIAAVAFKWLNVRMQTGIDVEAPGPRLLLRWSDDGGKTWGEQRILLAGNVGRTTQVIRFTRLGMTRRWGGSDRIFELSSTDPFAMGIVSASLEAG